MVYRLGAHCSETLQGLVNEIDNGLLIQPDRAFLVDPDLVRIDAFKDMTPNLFQRKLDACHGTSNLPVETNFRKNRLPP